MKLFRFRALNTCNLLFSLHGMSSLIYVDLTAADNDISAMPSSVVPGWASAGRTVVSFYSIHNLVKITEVLACQAKAKTFCSGQSHKQSRFSYLDNIHSYLKHYICIIIKNLTLWKFSCSLLCYLLETLH